MSCDIAYCKECRGTFERDRISRVTGLCAVCDEANPVPGLEARLEAAEKDLATTRETLGKAIAENDRLRIMLARSSEPCVYCNLPAGEIVRCALGFPGCARADDLLLADDIEQEVE